MPKNIMVDLETLGTTPGCAILSIGAVDYDEHGVGMEQFYTVVNTASCLEVFLSVEKATKDWWDKQSDEARKVITQASDINLSSPIDSSLEAFTQWMRRFGDDVLVWGNGADFDNAILQVAYSVCSKKAPWKFYNNRCYRTLKSLHPDIALERTGTYHNALDDARCQAVHAARLLKRQCDCAALWGDFQDDSVGEEGGTLLLTEIVSSGDTERQAEPAGGRIPRQDVPTGIR